MPVRYARSGVLITSSPYLMLNFTCATLACLAQYLGVGAITSTDGSTIIYESAARKTTYVCKASGPVYQCQEARAHIDGRFDKLYGPFQ